MYWKPTPSSPLAIALSIRFLPADFNCGGVIVTRAAAETDLGTTDQTDLQQFQGYVYYGGRMYNLMPVLWQWSCFLWFSDLPGLQLDKRKVVSQAGRAKIEAGGRRDQKA